MRKNIIILFGALALLCACEGTFTPGEYTSNSDIKPGPGLFSGETGEFVIYQGDPFQPRAKTDEKPDKKEE